MVNIIVGRYGRQQLLGSIKKVHQEAAEEERFSLQEQEREMIRKSLEHNGGKRKETAKALGISERTLYRKLKQYNMI